MQERASQLLGVTIAFLVLAWIAVSLRCFVRIRMVKAFGTDDFLIVASLIIFTVLSVVIIIGIHWGMGSHNADLSPHNIRQALKYQTLAEIFYIADTAIIKLSVGFLLLRITPNGARVYRYILWTSMVIFTTWTVMTFFVVLFQCRPVHYVWDQSSGDGKCLSGETIANFGYAFSAMDIVFDWLFALLPIPMLYHVKMSMQVKLSIFAILGLGVFASTATIVRLKYIVALTDPTDLLYSFAQTLIWTVIETGLGIVAASVATLRPIFKSFHIPGFSNSGSRGRSRPTPRTGYHQSYDLGYITQTYDTKTEGGGTKTTHTRTMSDGNTSQESILGGQRGIQKRTEVEVSYETHPEGPS